jgi:hypothetical protein
MAAAFARAAANRAAVSHATAERESVGEELGGASAAEQNPGFVACIVAAWTRPRAVGADPDAASSAICSLWRGFRPVGATRGPRERLGPNHGPAAWRGERATIMPPGVVWTRPANDHHQLGTAWEAL